MRPIVIATIKEWNIERAKAYGKRRKDLVVITDPKKLTAASLKAIDPSHVFFVHWSWAIPADIYGRFNCIGFHMTDLPFGRGGSPLQNLIVRGFKKTKISAIRIVKEMDAGPVFMKSDLDLKGTAQEIYERASGIIFGKMIPRLIRNSSTPKLQKGKVVQFKRRQPQESSIEGLKKLSEVYDHIRMLDAPGYPAAFLQQGNLRLSFRGATLQKNKLSAQVEIEVTHGK